MAKATGDCFEAALKFVVGLNPEERDRYRLCHGYPLGTGKIKGIRFSHAWVEESETVTWDDGRTHTFEFVIDKSNGKDAVLPKGWYYNLGAIDSDEVVRYEVAEAIYLAVSEGNYGPWDIPQTEDEIAYLEGGWNETTNR